MPPVSPLSAWFAGPAALGRFRRRLGRAPVILPPCDRAWRQVAPDFETALAMARSGLPFQIAAERRYDRSGEPRRLQDALARGETIFLPQVHQVLPRLMRLMVALRVAFLGPGREECSFLFMVEGRSREAMGLHHDGEVDAFWLQLEGRRTVTLGPQVPRGTPEDLPDTFAEPPRRGRGPWWTRDLGPGTLLYIPPRTPHRVVCRGRSLALSLTWRRRRRPMALSRRLAELAAWDVVSGQADRVPGPSRRWLWAQAPAAVGRLDGTRREFTLWLPGGATVRLPAQARRWATALAMMPRFPRPASQRTRAALTPLTEHGLVGPRDLPLLIIPRDPAALDGWRFAR